MKAILKSNRKIIVDVEYYTTFPCSGVTYVERETGVVFNEDELEFVEYQGG